MSATKYLEIIERIDHGIHFGRTGSPAEFARKLAISERSLYYYIAEMKGNGAPIYYSRPMETYSYSREGRFQLEFKYAEL